MVPVPTSSSTSEPPTAGSGTPPDRATISDIDDTGNDIDGVAVKLYAASNSSEHRVWVMGSTARTHDKRGL
jgi:hypothetical protein